MDAFGTAHRAQASTNGVARYAPIACAGPLLVAELEALESALDDPARPLVAIVGGAKVSTKLEVLRELAKKVDELVLGGGIANTVLAAAGVDVGKSLAERDMLDFARDLIGGKFGRAKIWLPTDAVIAPNVEPGARGTLKKIGQLSAEDMILDIGPETAAHYAERLEGAGTVVWNGPLGVFEQAEFAAGTRRVAEAVAASAAFSIAGGGETLAAIEQSAPSVRRVRVAADAHMGEIFHACFVRESGGLRLEGAESLDNVARFPPEPSAASTDTALAGDAWALHPQLLPAGIEAPTVTMPLARHVLALALAAGRAAWVDARHAEPAYVRGVSAWKTREQQSRHG